MCLHLPSVWWHNPLTHRVQRRFFPNNIAEFRRKDTTTMSQPILSAIHLYPIKSCGGSSLQEGEADARGLKYDRHWLVVTPEGAFLTQRDEPRLALIQPQLEADTLTIRAAGMSPLHIPLGLGGERMEVSIWRDRCSAYHQGSEAAQWFSDFLKTETCLVRMADDQVRRVNPKYARREDDQVGFADAYPFLLISEGSLNDLNSRMSSPLPMNRFRPNLVVSGVTPYAEDEWTQVQIGEMIFDLVKPCVRCVITTTDQVTAKRGKEPLRTLATYRDLPEKGVIFGQNLIHAAPGKIKVGDPVKVITHR